MDKPFYFISYSRSQLYFAESVAVQLQRLKINVWFDLQQLKTGEDWASEIKQGLDECAGVILIVSQRSMLSKYVEAEWKSALEGGKPVYLFYFEEAELTDERLKSCPAVDGRGRFNRAVRQLGRAIQGEETPHEVARFRQVRPPKRLARFLAADEDGVMRFPTKLAPGVLVATLSVIGISAVYLLALLMTIMLFGIPFSLWVGFMAGFGLLASSHYVRRKLTGPPPRFFVLAAVLGMFGLLAVTSQYPAQARTFAVFTVLVSIFAGLFVLALVFRGGDIFRWTLTGYALERVRRRYHGGRWVRRAGTGDHTITYRVLHSRGDEKFGKQLVKAMGRYNHVLTSNPEDHPDQYTFFLLSNLTDWEEVRTALAAYPRLIAAAMTTVTLPQDIKDQMGRFQYLDARTDAKKRFEAMAASLTETKVQSSTLSASIETTPANLDMTVIPQRVQAGLGSLRLYAVIGFVAPVLVVIQLLLMRGTSMPFTTVQIVGGVVAALLFALFCFFLDYLARFRQITSWMFIGLYAVGMLTYSVAAAAFGSIQIFGQNLSSDPLSVLPGIFIFLVTSFGLFAWLPGIAPRKLSLKDMRGQLGSVLRDVILISLIGSYAAFVMITTTVFAGLNMAQGFSINVGLGGAAAPAFSASTTSGGLTARFPRELRVYFLRDRQFEPNASFENPEIRGVMQNFVDSVSEGLGETFTPTYTAYASDDQGGGLSLLGGRFTSPSPTFIDYAERQMLDVLRQIDPNLTYQPERTFGLEPTTIQGAFAEFRLADESGAPVLGNMVAIDTASTHHFIYIVSSDTPALRAVIDQFYALLQSSP